MPGCRSARCDVAIVDQRGRELKRSLPVPACRSCEPAASSMPGRERRDDVRRENPARPVEHLRKAQHRHRRRPRIHRRDDAAASLRRRFEHQRHTQSCCRRVRLRRHRRRRMAGERHHQNDWGEPAEPPDKNAKDHHSDARQRSFAHTSVRTPLRVQRQTCHRISDDGVRAKLRPSPERNMRSDNLLGRVRLTVRRGLRVGLVARRDAPSTRRRHTRSPGMRWCSWRGSRRSQGGRLARGIHPCPVRRRV
jgi:hypothetical protein